MRYRRLSYRYTEIARTAWPRAVGDPWGLRSPPVLLRPQWRPSFDAFETGEGFTIRAELPGIDDDDCQIAIYEDAVVIEGERRWEPAPDALYHAAEIQHGPFRLEVPLPFPVDRDRVVAEIDRGFLVVKLPRRGGAL